MRKTILKLTTIVMLFVLAFSLVACSVIPQDYSEAMSNLHSNGYELQVAEKEEIMPDEEYSAIIGVVAQFLSIDASEKLETEMADSLSEITANLAKLEQKLDKVILGIHVTKENFILLCYFDDETTAREYNDSIKFMFEAAKSGGVNEGLVYASKDDLTYGVSGVVVYFGTQDALDAAK